MTHIARRAALGVLAVALLQASPAAAQPAGWTPQPPLRLARAGLSVATVNGQVLAVGGFDPPQVFAAVETRPLTGSQPWLAAPALTIARVNLATAVLNGRVYALGGYGATGDPLPAVETFVPGAPRWTEGLSLPQPRGGLAAAVLGGRIYVAGGIVPVGGGDFRPTASMIVFDPVGNAWRSVASMRTARERFRLVAAGGYLYAVGGRGDGGAALSTVERYDPATDTWRTIEPLRESRVVPCVVASRIGERPVLVAVGGAVFGADGSFVDGRCTTEVLDLLSGHWALLDVLLPANRISHDCAVQPDGTVLAIGGTTFAGGAFTELASVDALTLTPGDLA